MRHRFRNGEGFTLVEVMLALAIVSIGLIAILGLLPTGLRSARDAADNTISATVVQDVLTSTRNQPFAHVDLSGFGFPGGPYNLQNNYPPGPPAAIVAYFDQEGFSALPAAVQNHYYQVTLTFTKQATLPLSLVTATVAWPANSKNPANTSVFVTEIAQYN